MIAEQPYAVAAEFADAAELLSAARMVRAHGLHHWDVFSPYPIHGMDDAMGLSRSNLGRFVFVFGTIGAITAAALQFGVSSSIYPLDAGGKLNGLPALPAFIPIIFESTILFAAAAAVASMLIKNRLPRWNHPIFNWDRFAGVTGNKFFLAIEIDRNGISEEAAREILQSAGGSHITSIPNNP